MQKFRSLKKSRGFYSCFLIPHLSALNHKLISFYFVWNCSELLESRTFIGPQFLIRSITMP